MLVDIAITCVLEQYEYTNIVLIYIPCVLFSNHQQKVGVGINKENQHQVYNLMVNILLGKLIVLKEDFDLIIHL
jgi:hypothetical protein